MILIDVLIDLIVVAGKSDLIYSDQIVFNFINKVIYGKLTNKKKNNNILVLKKKYHKLCNLIFEENFFYFFKRKKTNINFLDEIN